MRRSLLVLSGFLFLCSCRQNNRAFDVGTFRDVPREIMAGSFFAEAEGDLERGNFLFVQDYDSLGFIRVNDKLVKMKLTKSIIDSVGNTMSEVYESPAYQLRLDVKYINDAGTENYDFEGRLVIEDKRGDTVAKTILGYDLVE